MSLDYSFDIIGNINMQEVLNAVTQSNKELTQRYDFKNSKSAITLNQKDHEITLISDDEIKMKSLIDLLDSKLVKRKVPLKALEYGALEPAAGGLVRQKVSLQSGISDEKCKEFVKYIKSTKIKVQAQIQNNQVRVSGKSKDDLQNIIQLLKEQDFKVHFECSNYR